MTSSTYYALEEQARTPQLRASWRGHPISTSLWARLVSDQGRDRYRIFKAGGRWRVTHAGNGIWDTKLFREGADSVGEILDELKLVRNMVIVTGLKPHK